MSTSFTQNNNRNVVITSATTVTTRTDGSPLQAGDIWIDTNEPGIKKISPTGGFVGKPYCFVNGTSNAIVGAGGRYQFNNAQVNVGNGWDNSTSTFTAPMFGTYLIVVNVRTSTSLAGANLEPILFLNASNFYLLQVGSSLNAATISTIVTLAQGQTFVINNGTGGAVTPRMTGGQDSSHVSVQML
jgi:hypothetical protein